MFLSYKTSVYYICINTIYLNSYFLQKLLVPETPTYDIKRISRGPPNSPNSPGGRIRVQLDHINVNCTEKETGYTPLIIAILNGKFKYRTETAILF